MAKTATHCGPQSVGDPHLKVVTNIFHLRCESSLTFVTNINLTFEIVKQNIVFRNKRLFTIKA